MSKRKHQLLSGCLIIAGWILNAVAWTIAGPHPYNTICVVAGLLLFIVGLIWFILSFKLTE